MTNQQLATLLHEIQGDVTASSGDVVAVLRKCKILASQVGDRDFSLWVESELNGYPGQQPVPDYRCLHANGFASFMNAGWRAERQPILWEVVPADARKALQNIDFRQGIATAKRQTARLNRPDVAIRLQGKMFPDMNCVAAWLEIPESEFDQMFSVIMNRILDFVLRIESDNPALATLPLTGHSASIGATPAIHNVFHGPIGNVAQGANSGGQFANTRNGAAERSWSREAKIALAALLVTILGTIAAWLVVPGLLK